MLDYTVDYVPGLLQVPGYSRALLAASIARRTREGVEAAVAVRAIRQQRLTSAEDPLGLTAIVDESVLHRPIGGPGVLAPQRAHLVTMAALPSVTLQVLPLAVGARATMGSGFIVLSFGDLGEPDLAYVEHALGAILLEKAADVASAKLKFDRLRSDALSPAESLALLRRVADGTRAAAGGIVDEALTWHKSSFSGDNGGGCVEVALLSDGGAAVRDTKDRSLPAHRFTAGRWTAFLAGVRAGEFDPPRSPRG